MTNTATNNMSSNHLSAQPVSRSGSERQKPATEASTLKAKESLSLRLIEKEFNSGKDVSKQFCLLSPEEQASSRSGSVPTTGCYSINKYNFATGIWSNDQGHKFQNGVRIE